MARPPRCRRICLEPEYAFFAPSDGMTASPVVLSVDEYEAIRLIDHEGRTHAQCAQQMGVARTTVTEMYERARGKIADCLVNGRPLQIAGGNYQLCDGSARRCCGRKCGRGQPQTIKKGEDPMKIAVTYENGAIFQHFGHSQQFKVYQVENGAVTHAHVVSAMGSGHGALAAFLKGLGIAQLICGGIGAGAQTALAEKGIQLFGGVKGDADAAVAALLEGRLAYDPQVHCDHHDHGEGHTCGHHCGEDHKGCSGNH